MTRVITVIANRQSGTNARDRNAIERALGVLGDRTRTTWWAPERDSMTDLVDRVVADGADLIVAAGGDGTAMAVADAMVGRDVPFAVLPLGTFNYFARGLGLSEDSAVAAAQIRDGTPHDIRVGEVNGQIFLNNASLGVYPAILRERETVYSQWGRFRLAAHWSVLKTFLRFRKPLSVELTVDGATEWRKTALIFVARSAYQLDRFRLEGADAIDHDRFAVLISRAETRLDLFRTTFRLAFGQPEEGRDYDLVTASDLTIRTRRRRRTLLAFDGEKRRERGDFRFRMAPNPLKIILPPGHPDIE